MGIGSYKAKQEKDTKVGLSAMGSAQSSISQAMDNVTQADNRLTTSRQSVSRAQKQHDWAREQRAMQYSPLGSTYNGWNSTQLGEKSAALQQGIDGMNASVTRLSDIKGRLINDGMSKTDPTIKSLNRKLYKHERKIKSDGRELKYLQYAQNEEIARASLEETQAKYREAESGRTHAEARLTDAKGNFDLAYSHLRPEARTAWEKSEHNEINQLKV